MQELTWSTLKYIQPAITWSKLTIETLEGVEHAQSQQ